MSGVIEHVTTRYPGGDAIAILTTGAEWTTSADMEAQRELDLEGGRLMDNVIRFSFSADRRLMSASAQARSRITKVVKTGATLAATALSAGMLLSGNESPEVDPALMGYDDACPTESAHLDSVRTQLADARTALGTARAAYLSEPPDGRADALYTRMRRLTVTVEELERDVDAAAQHFEAWRKANTDAWSEQVEAVLELRQLPRWTGTALDWASAAPAVSGRVGAREIWERLGFVIARSATAPSSRDRVDTPGPRSVQVRLPRTEEFVWLRRVGVSGDDVAPGIRVEQTFVRTVLDDHCDTEVIDLAAGAFRDHSVVLDFDTDGAMVGVSREVAGGADAAIGAVTEGVSHGLTWSKSVVDGVDGFADHRAAVRKARVDRELARARAEVELNGLGATAAEAAEVARLKQLAEIAGHQEAITQAGPAGIDALRTRDAASMAWYREPPSAQP